MNKKSRICDLFYAMLSPGQQQAFGVVSATLLADPTAVDNRNPTEPTPSQVARITSKAPPHVR